MQGIALGGSAVFLLLLTQATTPVAALLICGATGTSACAMSGFAPNCFDIAPKYADVIWGISNTFATVPAWSASTPGLARRPCRHVQRPSCPPLRCGCSAQLSILVFSSGRPLID
jgi:hypothetical protein